MFRLLFILLSVLTHSCQAGVLYPASRATRLDSTSSSSSSIQRQQHRRRDRKLTSNVQACQAAAAGQVLETEQSLNVRFYYELVLLENDDADAVLTAGHDMDQAVASYLTRELILKYCHTSNVTATTATSQNMVANTLRGVSVGGSRILSSRACVYLHSASPSTTTCYIVAGSNTLYLNDQVDIPSVALLERAFNNYIQQGFERGDIQLGDGIGKVHLLSDDDIVSLTTSNEILSSWQQTSTAMSSGINTTPMAGKVIGFFGMIMVALLACGLLATRSSFHTTTNAAEQYDARHQCQTKGREGGETSDSDESSEHTKERYCDRANPFAPREGQTLVWRNVDMTLSGKGRKQSNRKLLDNVWGEIPAKQTTVIMGPSGAGKTSLLNILAGRASSRGRVRIRADIRLNNFAVDPTNIRVRKMIAFVAQDDSLQITATPREAIWFSAKLRLARSTTDDQLSELTTHMISELGLTGCADTMIGGALVKGISGGERKRTSVGVELVVRPTMVFLDEPTSGLDAFSAAQVCQVLKKVSHAGASVLFTIHQPSSGIFASFDNLILLNLGRVMYQGRVANVQGFFRRRGYACPENFNPADWIMNVAQEPIEELEESGFFPSGERDIGAATEIDSFSELRCNESASNDILRHVGSFMQLKILFGREMLNIRRDKSILVPRTVMIATLATLVGIIFWQVGATSPAVNSNLQSHFGAIIVIVSMALLATGQATLLTFPDERPVFIREYSTRHYNVVSYFVSRLLVEAMLTATQIFVLVMVCFYMVQFQGNFLYFFSACYALAMTSTALASMVGAATGGNSELSLQFVPILFAAQMIFVGFFITPSLIPEWLRWLRYLSPATYAVRLVVVDEFYKCSSDPSELLNCELLMYNVDADVEHTWWYWLILSIQFLAFRVLALTILRLNARRYY